MTVKERFNVRGMIAAGRGAHLIPAKRRAGLVTPQLPMRGTESRRGLGRGRGANSAPVNDSVRGKEIRRGVGNDHAANATSHNVNSEPEPMGRAEKLKSFVANLRGKGGPPDHPVPSRGGPMSRGANSIPVGGQQKRGACFNCGGEGHNSKDCPEERKPRPATGTCYNCGKDGHMSKDCTEPKKERPPSGPCYNCGKDGHFSSNCPEPKKEKPADVGPDGEPINRNYIPEVRTIEDLYLEDKQNEELYRQVVDADENVMVTGLSNDDGLKIDTWQDAGFEEQLLINVTRSGYTRPRKIQAHVIPYVMEGRDIMGHAETGSGKTAAFMLPMINKIMNAKADVAVDGNGRKVCTPLAIVIAPTRELILQIAEQGRKFADKTNVQVAKAYGLYKVSENIRELLAGCDILCATPGRLKMFLNNNIISPKKLKYLVLDEADRLFGEGFTVDIRDITSVPDFPKKEARQTLMFSATFPTEVQNLAKEMLRDNFVMISNQKLIHANARISQSFVQVNNDDKNEKLLQLLTAEMEAAKNDHPDDPRIRRTLVFVKMRAASKVLAMFLTQHGVPAMMINGDMSQDLRERALKEFREYRTPVLVSTDVCARGIDIKELEHVINLDLPDTITTYIHRIGRTGRIKEGFATSFFDGNNREDAGIVAELVQIVRDSGRDPPEFLVELNNIQESDRAFLNMPFKSRFNYDEQPEE